MKRKFNNVTEYISQFSRVAGDRLQILRSLLHTIAPDAEESISYGMPAYKLGGKPLIYFAGYERHTGLYALPSGHKKFSKELSRFKQGKGSVQFPHEEDLPVELIKKIIKFRVSENIKDTTIRSAEKAVRKRKISSSKVKPKKK
ncbi:MAG: iron chaperone [Cyclobacteriaceae bacterium]